ncbi:MAG: 2-deoxy-scyllo-inosamine dehydrogenase [Planctomycetes bacterium ADurb.Bin126]|nr:MAG: 2-deoxy-scyllo-inosamine dehydrogenase [Planctomycetes bacterium ADurb.Bin126]HOD84759.1 alcohol dehydrogenase catalytic domain-containing protein [Phycisphaerae bacterium]HQL73042.1 alcohol dehydrogenase catalytic domain-containing protein [Phycisphaerae bacterium]
MLALTYDGKKAALRRKYADPQIARGQALVAVHVAGVCKTDLEILKGYMGFTGVLGHEFVGHVVEGPAAWKGKRVVGEINCPCGRCGLCRSGLSNHCPNRTVLGIDRHDGAFAQYLVLPTANLHEVPASLEDDQAVFAEPLAAACQITRQVRVCPRDSVVVLGDGRLGQLAARVLKLKTRKLLLVGRHAAKLEAAEKASIQTATDKDFVPARKADIVVDATGSASGFELAMRTVRPRGTIVLKSTIAAKSGMNLAPLVVDEITVVGSRCGPFGEALKLLATGQVDVTALLSRTLPLDRGLEALEAARSSNAMKVLIEVARP